MACLIDSGNLFNDIISRETCDIMMVPYETASVRLKTANVKQIMIIGRVRKPIYFKIDTVDRVYSMKPFVVESLFTPIMLSAFFTKRYLVQLDAIDDTMSLQVARGEPRTKVPLHTNAITRALILLD